MHDPKVVSFDIHGPRGLLHKWRRDHADRYDHQDPRFSYISPLITIWHNDPETDGSDDSCGWSHPKAGRFYGDRLSDADTKPISKLQHEMMELVEGKPSKHISADEMVDQMFGLLEALEDKMKS